QFCWSSKNHLQICRMPWSAPPQKDNQTPQKHDQTSTGQLAHRLPKSVRPVACGSLSFRREMMTVKRVLSLVGGFIAIFGIPLAAQAHSVDDQIKRLQEAVVAAQNSADNGWMLICCALVLLMTGPGLALFYGGLVNRKNVLATMMQSFVLMAVVTVI